jgi:hypothetical protein
MPRKSKKVSVDKSQFIHYKKIADGFYLGALAEKNSGRWNASGVLIVHSAIAYADSVTIKYGGVKSKGDDHQEVVRLLENLVPGSETKDSALNQLERLIAHKTSVSYSGRIYDKEDIEKLFKHLERFKTWAEKQISD